MKIREVRLEDAKALLGIYGYYVENTNVTFEYVIPTEEEFKKRIENTIKRYPYFVVEENEEIIGYAYVSTFKTRRAYDWSVETTVYVKNDCHAKGVGTMLYMALEEALKKQHICNLCACIAYPNEKSEKFHEKMGYQKVAHFHKSGYKRGEWTDMIWMEKTLCEHEDFPQEFIPYPDVNRED